MDLKRVEKTVREAIATLDDWQGLHAFADSVRHEELGRFAMTMEVVGLCSVPIGIVVSIVFTGRLHTRKCDCRR